MIYVVEHENKAFKGFSSGMDFHNGIGSTNSQEDARRAQERGWTIRDLKGRRLYLRRTFDDKGRERFVPSETPMPDELGPKPKQREKAKRKQGNTL